MVSQMTPPTFRRYEMRPTNGCSRISAKRNWRKEEIVSTTEQLAAPTYMPCKAASKLSFMSNNLLSLVIANTS